VAEGLAIASFMGLNDSLTKDEFMISINGRDTDFVEYTDEHNVELKDWIERENEMRELDDQTKEK